MSSNVSAGKASGYSQRIDCMSNHQRLLFSRTYTRGAGHCTLFAKQSLDQLNPNQPQARVTMRCPVYLLRIIESEPSF